MKTKSCVMESLKINFMEFGISRVCHSDLHFVKMDYINTAMERLAKSDVKFRFVLDVGNSLSSCK
ncbi:hypothetical protein CK203_033391 [Vitis vinifera]|uniref:Uncharacterized protein n=1 Tax=Vitis vinifera TaxID=29760 RepID=A0A438HMW0_VITVI|nr:hypothetical protein CK203_033391 [Vitis vinifera]